MPCGRTGDGRERLLSERGAGVQGGGSGAETAVVVMNLTAVSEGKLEFRTSAPSVQSSAKRTKLGLLC